MSSFAKVTTLRKRKYSAEAVNIDEAQSGKSPSCVNLTTHAQTFMSKPVSISWGKEDPADRGPIIATNRHEGLRNAIGAHGGSYCVYRALAVAAGKLDTEYMPQLQNTTPAIKIGPHPQWSDPKKIVTMDPYGHIITEAFPEFLAKGYDIRPTIAVTQATMDVPELKAALKEGRIKADGKYLLPGGQVRIGKAAMEPVWYLPGIAERFGVSEYKLRECLFQQTNGMYPELLTRVDMKVFLPPIGGNTAYIFGDPAFLSDESKVLTCRVHDECNGSDVFGSDICTCRPYLFHAIEECTKAAQNGGVGLIIYYRKEGRSLGEVTKYLVYNLRKRQEGGDLASKYFDCTKTVAGIEDVRFQELMTDPLHWLGITKIDRFISMSDMKYNAIVNSGIKILERVPIPKELVPDDAHVEINAKVHAGYEGGQVYGTVTKEDLEKVKGRNEAESHKAP